MEQTTVTLYYLTGTGNSLKIAKDIGSRLGDHKLVSMPRLMKETNKPLIEGDVVGFIFPVYFAHLPEFIREFLAQTDFGNIAYLFAAANGGGLFGRTLREFADCAAEKGKTLDAGFRVRMPSNHPRIALLRRKGRGFMAEEETERVAGITEIIREREPFGDEIRKGIGGMIVSFLFGFDIPYEYSRNHVLDNYFWLNENCGVCGQCARICPVGNIVMTRRRPLWENRCISCFACYNYCPWDSIQVKCPWKIFPRENDWTPMPRYHHPETG